MICPSGKRGWPTERTATSGAKAVARTGARRMTVYQCPDCKGYHITSAPRMPTDRDAPHRPGSPQQRGRRPLPGQSVEELAAEMRRARAEE